MTCHSIKRLLASERATGSIVLQCIVHERSGLLKLQHELPPVPNIKEEGLRGKQLQVVSIVRVDVLTQGRCSTAYVETQV